MDPVKAEAEGLTPASIGSVVYSNLSGVKAATISVNGEDQDVKVEFAPDRYDSIAKLQGMMITRRRAIRFRWRIWQRFTPGQPTGDFTKRETVPGIDHDAGTGRL